MYGLVNKAIQDLIVSKYDQITWGEIKTHSKVTEDIFIGNLIYDDSVTFGLAVSSAEVLGITLNDFLEKLGEFWVLDTGLKHYNHYMTTGGSNFKDFIINLPHFHTRIQLVFKEIQPPEFEITDIKENSLSVHYYSTRTGLTHFVYGLLNGLGIMFKQKINIKIGESINNNIKHDVFYINW